MNGLKHKAFLDFFYVYKDLFFLCEELGTFLICTQYVSFRCTLQFCTHEMKALYNVQDDNKRAVLYCDVNVSCGEKDSFKPQSHTACSIVCILKYTF